MRGSDRAARLKLTRVHLAVVSTLPHLWVLGHVCIAAPCNSDSPGLGARESPGQERHLVGSRMHVPQQGIIGTRRQGADAWPAGRRLAHELWALTDYPCTQSYSQ